MGRLKTYPKYDKTDVSWLENKPSHWRLLPGRACLEMRGEPNIGLKEKNVLSLSHGRIIEKSADKLHGLVPESFETYQLIKPGDVICRPTDLQNDQTSLRFGISKYTGIITSAYINFRMRDMLTPEYGYMLLHSYDLKKVFYGLGSGLRQNLDWKDFKYLPCLIPPFPEQEAIVRFLNYIDLKVRKFINAKRRLISLLNEQKQAIIHQAVTRGLDPNVKLKPSGVEWLGDVPEHWDSAIKIKFISSLKGRLGWQGLKANEYLDIGPYVVSSAHFKNHKIIWDICPHVSQERYEIDTNIQLTVGDVLLMKDGAAMGKLAYVDHLPSEACLNSHLLLFRPILKHGSMTYDARYLFYFMMTNPFQRYIQINGTGATFLGISQEALGNYRICLPPLHEQKTIALTLDRETAKINTALAIIDGQISQILDYRNRLIADVVTGNLNVNEAVSDLREEPKEAEFVALEELTMAEEEGENEHIEAEEALA